MSGRFRFARAGLPSQCSVPASAPLPLTLLRSSYVLLPHTWALVVLEYVRGSCSVDVTCKAVLERVLRNLYCQVIIYCSTIPLQRA